jgi:hypothetical protein
MVSVVPLTTAVPFSRLVELQPPVDTLLERLTLPSA